MSASVAVELIGYLLAAWGLGFGMGHLLKAFRDFMRQV